MLIDLVKKYFDEQKWDYSKSEEKDTFFFGMNGGNGNFNCIAEVQEDKRRFIFLSVLGFNAPENKRNDVAELINRLNFELFYGNFEMDYSDGEIRCRTSILYNSFEPSIEMLDELIIANLMAIDDALPAFTSLIYNNSTAIEAIATIEKTIKAPNSNTDSTAN